MPLYLGLTCLMFCLCEAAGTKRVNMFMRGIYSSDALIPSEMANSFSALLCDFIRAYVYEARASYELGLSHFPLHPKLHALHEIAHQLKRQAGLGMAINPAVFSCSMDEDFIGRSCTVSRCVSPRLLSKRTLQRYLAYIQFAWARGS